MVIKKEKKIWKTLITLLSGIYIIKYFLCVCVYIYCIYNHFPENISKNRMLKKKTSDNVFLLFNMLLWQEEKIIKKQIHLVIHCITSGI